MRPRIGIRTCSLVALALIACTALTPSGALADDLPDAIDDPVEAVMPQPTAPEAGADTAPDADEPDVVVKAQDESSSAAQDDRAARRASTPGYVAPAPTGALPFTGADPRQIVLVLLVGLVVTSGGVVALAWARASAART